MKKIFFVAAMLGVFTVFTNAQTTADKTHPKKATPSAAAASISTSSMAAADTTWPKKHTTGARKKTPKPAKKSGQK